ncbi:MAG TPA: DNA repair protein RecO [Actinomycetales bacterium]|nr:DNA repair protein RecO [Actinomycetales bacterium]
MKLYRDEAIVLRTQKLGEADRIVTLLTRSHGMVRAVAKGVRRTSSRFGSRLEPFMHVDIQLYRGRNLDTVTQVETVNRHADAIGQDYQLYTAGTAILETAQRLTESEAGTTQQFLLLAGCLSALSQRREPAELILNSYLLRALAIAGWAPSFSECAKCGRPGPHRAFAIIAGGVVCPSCRPPGAVAPDPLTLELLGALLSGDWERARQSESRQRREADGLVAAYVQWHLERTVRSLKLVDRP